MSKRHTPGKFIETGIVLFVLLGIALCLQLGVFNKENATHFRNDAAQVVCCVAVADTRHDHTDDATAPVDVVVSAVSPEHFGPKLGPAPAFQPHPVLFPYLLDRYEALPVARVALLWTDRHILFRCLRI